MNITYIYHSCFLVETGSCYYLFDYFKGSLPALKPGKPVVVLSSHSHGDHYSPAVFSLLEELTDAQVWGVLSKDIFTSRLPVREKLSILSVAPRRQYQLPWGQQLTTFRSTDQGVAFLLQEEEGTIYHAGDLNDWVWEGEPEKDNREMTRKFQAEIQSLAAMQVEVDVAFLPLDPRQEKDYHRGVVYFIEQIHPKKVYPMHYWEQPQIITQFLSEYPEYGKFIVATESIIVNKK